jgi:hypothetical protein
MDIVDTLGHILSFCGAGDLLICERVNKLWYELSNQKNLWERQYELLATQFELLTKVSTLDDGINCKAEAVKLYRYLHMLRLLIEKPYISPVAILLRCAIPLDAPAYKPFYDTVKRLEKQHKLSAGDIARKYLPEGCADRDNGWYRYPLAWSDMGSTVGWNKAVFHLLYMTRVEIPTEHIDTWAAGRYDNNDHDRVMVFTKTSKRRAVLSVRDHVILSIIRTLQTRYQMNDLQVADKWRAIIAKQNRKRKREDSEDSNSYKCIRYSATFRVFYKIREHYL